MYADSQGTHVENKYAVSVSMSQSAVSHPFWDPMTSQSRDVNKHVGEVNDLWQEWRQM